jgi:hypothetical protein
MVISCPSTPIYLITASNFYDLPNSSNRAALILKLTIRPILASLIGMSYSLIFKKTSACLLLGLGIFLSFQGLKLFLKFHNEMPSFNIPIEGIVTSFMPSSTLNDSCTIEYSYTVAEETFRGSESRLSGCNIIFGISEVGQTIRLKVDSSQPNRSYIEPVPSGTIDGIAFALMGVLFLSISIVLFIKPNLVPL